MWGTQFSVLCKNRHKFISQMLCFDDKDLQAVRFQTDRFCAIRDVFVMINKNFAKFKSPDMYNAIVWFLLEGH